MKPNPDGACPFCGGSENFMIRYAADSFVLYAVVCMRCKARGPSALDPEDAALKWKEGCPTALPVEVPQNGTERPCGLL